MMWLWNSPLPSHIPSESPPLVGLVWTGGDRASLTSASRDAFLYWGVFHFRSLSTAHSCHMPSRKYGKKLCQAQLQTDNKKQGL